MSNTKSPGSGASENIADGVVGDETSGRSSFAPLATVATVVLLVDQVTKIWAVGALGDRDIDIFWTLRLHLISNHGSAFGLGSGLGRWLVVLVVAAVIAVILYARRVTNKLMLLLFGLIIGGAIGNLVDRVARAEDGFLSGGVVDFIDLQWWPVFNVADIAVVTGAIALMLLSMREESEHPA